VLRRDVRSVEEIRFLGLHQTVSDLELLSGLVYVLDRFLETR